MSSLPDYLPVRVGTFRAGLPLRFDVFVRIGEKYIRYFAKPDSIDADRLMQIKGKGIKKLFIVHEDEPEYLVYLDEGLKTISDPASGTIEQRADIAQQTLGRIAGNPNDVIARGEMGIREAANRIDKVAAFIRTETGALRQMLESSGFAVDNVQHGANVAALSLALAQRNGIADAKEVSELALAALLHDLSCAELGVPAWAEPEKLATDVRSKYESHPVVSAEKASQNPSMPRRLLDLILNHEEKGDGLGFPGGRILSQLPKTQQILNLADAYDHLCSDLQLSPIEAHKTFLTSRMGLYDLALIQSLGGLVRGA